MYNAGLACLDESGAMFGKLMPREAEFFDLFNAHAEEIVKGSQSLVALMAALIETPAEAVKHAEAIDEFESRADKITHDTIALIHTTFVTPFDRDEIHSLISGLDDILDLIQDVAECLNLYDIQTVTPEANELAALSLKCSERVRSAVNLLKSMDNGEKILEICHEIDQLESEADRVMRTAMSRLFREEPDVRQLIKFKAVYELLETVTDRCEDVANIIEGIVLENS
ncbi:MAG: hypothetical protein RIR18_2281 [Pseudomonadota bacterium]|jgi:predicted phosphate transport protein (TIGR00153 family)